MSTELNRGAFVGLRLRVVQQLIDKQGREVLDCYQIKVPPVCVSVLVQIAQSKKANVSEIIDALQLSRQTVLQRLKALESNALIFSEPGTHDRRHRIICLSPHGQREVKKLDLLIGNLDRVFDEIGQEVGVNLVTLFKQIENSLRQESLVERLSSLSNLDETGLQAMAGKNV